MLRVLTADVTTLVHSHIPTPHPHGDGAERLTNGLEEGVKQTPDDGLEEDGEDAEIDEEEFEKRLSQPYHSKVKQAYHCTPHQSREQTNDERAEIVNGRLYITVMMSLSQYVHAIIIKKCHVITGPVNKGFFYL